MAYVMPLAYFSLGAFTIVVQAILLREFFVAAAGSEISFAIAMAGWLLGVGAGSLAGALFSSRRRATAVAFAWSALAMCALAPLLVAAVRSLRAIVGALPGMPLPLSMSLVLVPLLSLPFCVLNGFAFPLAAALRPLPPQAAAGTLARAYAWEAIGAMAGGAIYSFLLAGRSAPLPTIALVALPLLAVAGAVAWRGGGAKTAAISLAALFLFLAGIAAGVAGRGDSLLAQWRWQGISSARLVAAVDTRFQNLQLGLDSGQYSLFANGQLAAVFPDDEGNELLAAMLLSQHPRPRRVLVIGDAAGGLAKHLLRYPLTGLTAVEIDPGFSALIRAHLGPGDRRALADPRLSWRPMDGRRFVLLDAARATASGGRFDLAFINQPDAWTAQINRFYTREFFLDLRRLMTPGGVVALRLASSENYASEIVTPYTAAIFQTLASVFPTVALSPGTSTFLFASNSAPSVSEDPEVLAGRYRESAPAPARLSPVFAALYPAEKCAYVRNALTTCRVPSLNLDDRPIAYFLGSRLLGWSTGGAIDPLFAWFAHLSLPGILAVLGLPFLVSFLWSAIRPRRNALLTVVVAAAAGGFAGLSFEITALFVFQNAWGYVYQAVGLLIAIFMMGLGTGAAWTARRIAKADPPPARAARLLAGTLLLTSMGAAAFMLLRHGLRPAWPGQLLLAAWLAAMGILAGAVLPLGMRVVAPLPAARGGGMLNAGDYLGGAAGSILTAAFFMPLLGTTTSLAIVAMLAALAAALLAFAARSGALGRRG